ncbi:hypothetical protein BJY04DRAFT_167158 [Aspergillus karnatakaensis]|uniref:uncharacterized protein n=1 Tax=Aspergillus karnatakaensis TaxID=1810916 RepID=UPI003CCD23F7
MSEPPPIPIYTDSLPRPNKTDVETLPSPIARRRTPQHTSLDIVVPLQRNRAPARHGKESPRTGRDTLVVPLAVARVWDQAAGVAALGADLLR